MSEYPVRRHLALSATRSINVEAHSLPKPAQFFIQYPPPVLILLSRVLRFGHTQCFCYLDLSSRLELVASLSLQDHATHPDDNHGTPSVTVSVTHAPADKVVKKKKSVAPPVAGPIGRLTSIPHAELPIKSGRSVRLKINI
jgi:hypothetical protein